MHTMNASSSSLQANDVLEGEWHVRYRYPLGEVSARFFNALREGRIIASRCSVSNLTYLPPRAYCERSFAACDEWVEAAMEGTIEASTVVTAAFENLPAPPYAIAYVRLDGVDTAMINFVRGIDLSDVPAAASHLAPGTRVRVVFGDKLQGRITDFHYELIA